MLPPINHGDKFTNISSYATQRSDSPPRSTHGPQRYSPQPPPPPNQHNRNQSPNVEKSSHAYGLYRSSSTGELIHQHTSAINYFPRETRSTRSDPGYSSRKHVCDQCGERFGRRSGLEVCSTCLPKTPFNREFLCSHTGGRIVEPGVIIISSTPQIISNTHCTLFLLSI
jgi:hypothetical protein